MEESLVVVLGSFEHQMLEQMREAGAAGMLVFRSDVIPEVHGRHRQPMVFVKNHPQAVVEYVLRERDVHEESGTAARL